MIKLKIIINKLLIVNSKLILSEIFFFFRFYPNSLVEFKLDRLITLYLYRQIETKNFNRLEFENTCIRIDNFINKIKNKKKLWAKIYYIMSSYYAYKCDFNNWIECNNKIIELSNQENVKIGVIELGYFSKTIGSSYTIDAFIKSMKLHFTKIQKIEFYLKDRNEFVNPKMLEYWEKYIDLKIGKKNFKFYKKNLSKNNIWHDVFIPCDLNVKKKYAHSSGVYIQKKWDEKNLKPLFSINDHDKKKSHALLSKIGIKENDWYVTLHVRESKYKGEESYRDSNINNFQEAINYITSMGGWVIRMGDKSMSSIKIKDEKFFDYANSDFKSDLLDVFFCATAKFMIGTSSGLSALSYIFGVPLALTNLLPTATVYLSKRDMFIPRILKSKKNDKLLKFSEIFSPPINIAMIDGSYRNLLELDFVENTSDEIFNLIKEMFENISNNKKNLINDELQERFHKNLENIEPLIGFPGMRFQCNVSSYFLKKYINLL